MIYDGLRVGQLFCFVLFYFIFRGERGRICTRVYIKRIFVEIRGKFCRFVREINDACVVVIMEREWMERRWRLRMGENR